LGPIEQVEHVTLRWLRIGQIYPLSATDRFLQWSIFSSPRPEDIQQGALGDCWLMAALALLTERPQMLDHILLTKTVNKEGVYLVRLCHNGLWKTILVDDCFPCTQYGYLAFTQANRRQLYVPLIEKACAKLFGSYGDLISGQTEEGLQLLTGTPCDHLELNPSGSTVDGDLIWAKLLSACESQ
jgi:calpain-15